jgi:hypothetical protein
MGSGQPQRAGARVSTTDDGRLDRRVVPHELSYLAEGDDVTVGRRDIDAHAVLSVEVAELVRRLANGLTPRQAAAWYRETYGERIDVLDLVTTLEELGFLCVAAQSPAQARWQRLGRALLARPAWLRYGLLVAAALVVLVHARPVRVAPPEPVAHPFPARGRTWRVRRPVPVVAGPRRPGRLVPSAGLSAALGVLIVAPSRRDRRNRTE